MFSEIIPFVCEPYEIQRGMPVKIQLLHSVEFRMLLKTPFKDGRRRVISRAYACHVISSV